MHLLLFLSQNVPSTSNLTLSTRLSVLSCHQPSETWNNDPHLREMIQSTMIQYGPCGDHEHNPEAPCMVIDCKTGELRCSKRFPKDFCPATFVQESGYPLYKRRHDFTTSFVRTMRGRNVTIDNRWVVPYNTLHSARLWVQS